MTAMILAAGYGKRMRPLTDTTPKPLLKVKDKELILWHIEKLVNKGFKKIVINISYLGEQIIDALGNGSQWNIEIIYSDERESGPVETAGAIIKALPHLSETFLVLNGDIWCDYDFDINFKLADKPVHLVLVPNPEHNSTGDFKYLGSSYTFSGIGYYSKSIFTHIPLERLPLAPILKGLAVKKKVSFELYNGIWSDIGTPERLAQVNAL